MNTQEFYYECEKFRNFGKIKDIDFNYKLWMLPIDEANLLHIAEINFEEETVILRQEYDYGRWFNTTYDLYALASEGHLSLILDRLSEVLDEKVGV